jgi:hypothetical protein
MFETIEIKSRNVRNKRKEEKLTMSKPHCCSGARLISGKPTVKPVRVL